MERNLLAHDPVSGRTGERGAGRPTEAACGREEACGVMSIGSFCAAPEGETTMFCARAQSCGQLLGAMLIHLYRGICL